MMPGVRRGDGDRGSSLLEVLLAVAIVGISMAGLLTGLLSFVVSSDRNDEAATANRVLVQVTDALRGPTVPYSAACVAQPYAVPANLASWGVDLPTGWTSATVDIVSVRHWNGTTFSSSCPGTLDVQEITVRVSDPGGHVEAAMAIVKRDR